MFLYMRAGVYGIGELLLLYLEFVQIFFDTHTFRVAVISIFKKIYGKFHMKFHGKFIFKAKTVRTAVNNINYELDLSQLIDSSIYFYGCFEEETTKRLSKMVEPGMTILDIGANVGCHTLPMAMSVGPTGKIIAFEPMEWARKKLITNIGLNEFDNISIEDIALSDEPGRQLLRFKSNWPLDKISQPEACTEQDITLEKLDDYVDRKKLNVDLIKIDVDGFEYKVFRGAYNLLKKQKPVILTEFGHTTNRVGEKLEDMIQFLKDLEYGFYTEKDMIEIKDPLKLVNSYAGSTEKTINIVLK